MPNFGRAISQDQGKNWWDMVRTKDEKLKAKAMILSGSSAEDVSRAMNIPVRTIRSWRTEWQEDEKFVEQKQSFEDQFLNNCNTIISKAQELIIDQLDSSKETGEAIDLSKLNQTIGVHYDKKALATGNATENTQMVIKVEIK